MGEGGVRDRGKEGQQRWEAGRDKRHEQQDEFVPCIDRNKATRRCVG